MTWITDKAKSKGYEWPLAIDEAAVVMDFSTRKFRDVVNQYPHYHRKGNRKVFGPEDLERIWQCLGSSKEEKSTTSGGLLAENAYEKALKHLTASPQKNSATSGKRNSGKVVMIRTSRMR